MTIRNLLPSPVWSPEDAGAGAGSAAPASAPSPGGSTESSGSTPSDGGGATTPSSTPGASPPIAPDDFFDMPGQDEIDALAGEFESDDGSLARDPATGRFLPKSGETGATPTPAVVPLAPAGTVPTAEVQPAPAGEPAGGPAAAAATALPTDATLLEQLDFAEQEVIPHLAEMYSIPDQFAASFTPEQRGGMKMLAATLHFNVMRAVLKNVQGEIPGMVNRMFQHQAAQKHHETKFFEAWPELTPADLPTVRQFGSIFARGNPQAGFDDFVNAVGAMTMQSLGRVRGAVQAPAQPGVGHMAAAPPPANVRPVSHRPANVTPVGPNGGQPPARPASGNSWDQYSQLWDSDPST